MIFFQIFSSYELDKISFALTEYFAATMEQYQYQSASASK